MVGSDRPVNERSSDKLSNGPIFAKARIAKEVQRSKHNTPYTSVDSKDVVEHIRHYESVRMEQRSFHRRRCRICSPMPHATPTPVSIDGCRVRRHTAPAVMKITRCRRLLPSGLQGCSLSAKKSFAISLNTNCHYWTSNTFLHSTIFGFLC